MSGDVGRRDKEAPDERSGSGRAGALVPGHRPVPVAIAHRREPGLAVRRIRDVRADPHRGYRPAPARTGRADRAGRVPHRRDDRHHAAGLGLRRHARRCLRRLLRPPPRAAGLDGHLRGVHRADGRLVVVGVVPRPAVPHRFRARLGVGHRHVADRRDVAGARARQGRRPHAVRPRPRVLHRLGVLVLRRADRAGRVAVHVPDRRAARPVRAVAAPLSPGVAAVEGSPAAAAGPAAP